MWDHERDDRFDEPVGIVGACEVCGAGVDENEGFVFCETSDGADGIEEVLVCEDCCDEQWEMYRAGLI